MAENLRNKSVLVYEYGTFVGIAERLARDFGKVYYFSPWKSSFPQKKLVCIGEGLENIERVNSFWDYVDDADIIFFPDVIDGDIQVHLDTLGKHVWGSRMGENLELDRFGLKKLLKELKLPVGKYESVIGITNLRKYLKSHKDIWVKVSCFRGDFETFKSVNYDFIETRLYEIEQNLGILKEEVEFLCENDLPDKVELGYDGYFVNGQFPTKSVCGIEIKDAGYIGIFKDYSKLPKPIIEVNTKLAPILKKYNYNNFFSTEVRVGKDGLGYLIDPCFDDKTEVLTNEGWKFFKDLNRNESVATLNQYGFLEYQLPTDYLINNYKGKMIHFSNRKNSFDCLVTPNHLVLRSDRNKKKLFKERADSLTDKGYIPRTAKWIGNNKEYFTLPMYHKEWDFIGQYGQYVCKKVKHIPEVKIPMKDWVKFMGWYLSEGSLGGKWTVQVSQFKHQEEVKEMFKNLPFKYAYNNGNFRMCSVQLVNYLKKYGLCDKKYIPDYIKNASPEIIRIFLDAFNLGDGSIHKGNKVYYTTSIDLADGIQELLLKVGSIGNIMTIQAKGTIAKIKDKEYIRNHNSYTIYERNNFKSYWFETQGRKHLYINEKDYNGKVYCVTTPNNTVFVRRNGKPNWSSNCMRCGSPPSEVYQELYTNISDIVWNGAHGKLIDPIVKDKFAVEAIIHCNWAERNWLSVLRPEKYKHNIKFRNVTRRGDVHYIVPQYIGLPEIGSVVTTGNSIDSCIDQITEIAESIKGFYVEIPLESLDKAKEEVAKTKEFGYNLFE